MVMVTKIKYALVFALCSTSLSTFALSDVAESPLTYGKMGDSFNQDQKLKKITSAYPAAKPVEQYGNSNMVFKSFVARKVLITFDNHLKGLESLDKEYIGKEITEETIAEICDKIVAYYIESDYLLPQVSVDKFALKNGILKMDVKAAHFDNVVLVGEGTDNALLKEYADKISQSKPTKKSEVQKYLALMNKIPGYEIVYQLDENKKKSKENKESVDLIIFVTKKTKSAFLGTDNYGTNDLGKYQMFAVGEIFTPFSDRDSLQVNASTSNLPDRIVSIGSGYSYILHSSGTKAHLNVSHAETNPTKRYPTHASNSTGDNVRLAVTQPLYLRARQDLQFELGTTYNNAVSYQVVNNASQKYKVSKYNSGDMGLNYQFKDNFGGNSFSHLSYVRGLDGTFYNYIDSDTTTKHYKLIKFNLHRDQKLVKDFSLYFSSSVMHSDDSLPDAEKASLGGHDFGRGYSFATIDGTKMYAAALELRYTHKMNNSKYAFDHIQPYLFIDGGHLNKQDPSTTVSHLESAGGGVRLRFLNRADIGMEVAQPFKKNFVVDNTNVKAKTKFNFFINKVFEF